MDAVIKWLMAMNALVVIHIAAMLLFLVYLKRLNRKELLIAAVIFLYSIAELAGFSMGVFQVKNQWFYNVIMVPQILLVVYTLTVSMENLKTAKILMWIAIIISSAHIIKLTWFHEPGTFSMYTYIPGNTIIAAAAYFHLRERLECLDENPFDSIFTWFSIATLIDNAASIPLLTTLGWQGFDTAMQAKLWIIITTFYILWYLLISFGLIWTKIYRSSRFSSQ